MNLTPEQTKVAEGGTYAAGGKAEIHDRAGLFAGIIGFGVAMLSLGVAWQSDKNHDARTQAQQEQIAEQKKEIMLLREDVRELTIEVRGKPK